MGVSVVYAYHLVCVGCHGIATGRFWRRPCFVFHQKRFRLRLKEVVAGYPVPEDVSLRLPPEVRVELLIEEVVFYPHRHLFVIEVDA